MLLSCKTRPTSILDSRWNEMSCNYLPKSSSAMHMYVRPSNTMIWKMCLSQTYDIRLSVDGIFSRIFLVILAKFPAKIITLTT